MRRSSGTVQSAVRIRRLQGMVCHSPAASAARSAHLLQLRVKLPDYFGTGKALHGPLVGAVLINVLRIEMTRRGLSHFAIP